MAKPLTSSEQARADAMADAETLLTFAAVYCDGRSALGKLTGLWRRAADIETLALPGMVDDDYRSFAQAHYSARAAFRAVPALRG